MEKSLMEKLRNGNCDEIDKEMIASRVENALKKSSYFVFWLSKRV